MSLFSTESVFKGHPSSWVTSFPTQCWTRAWVETAAKGNMLMVAGEITTQTKIFARVLCGESQQALASICMSTASLGSIARACATRPTMFW